MAFPPSGFEGWQELGAVAGPPVSRPLPVAHTALWFDPAPGGGSLAEYEARIVGASTVRVYGGISQEARFSRPEVFGAVLLDSFGEGEDFVPFPFRFFWPIQYGYLFLTNILTADDGQEQRIASRNPARPRRRASGRVMVKHRSAFAHLQALLHGWNTKPFGVPIWCDVMVITEPVAIGDLVITVESESERDVIPGRLVLLWQDYDRWEVATIESVAVGQVTLEAEVLGAWAARETLLVPMRLGRLADVVDFSRPGPYLADMQVDFLLDPSE